MKFGRRLTAVGMLTGGLLLVGFAAPSLADVGSADGVTGTTSSVTSNAGSTTDTQAAEQAAQPQDATSRGDTGETESAKTDSGDTESTQQVRLQAVTARTLGPTADFPEDIPTACLGITDPELLAACIKDNTTGNNDDDPCTPPQHDQESDISGCQPETCEDNPDQEGCPTTDECTIDQDLTADGCQTQPCAVDSSQKGCDSTRCASTRTTRPRVASHSRARSRRASPAARLRPVNPAATTAVTPAGATATAGTRPARPRPRATAAEQWRPGHQRRRLLEQQRLRLRGHRPRHEPPAPRPGTSVCGDPAICNDSGILGVDASHSTPTTTTTSPSTVAGTGSTLPETGAAAGSQGMLVIGFGLLAAGALLVRPRRLARHRA